MEQNALLSAYAEELNRKAQTDSPRTREIIFGVGIAGGIYPFVLAIGACPFLLWQEGPAGCLWAFCFAGLAAMIGLMYATLIAAFWVASLRLLFATLKVSVHPIKTGALVGGLSGFFAIGLPIVTEPNLLTDGLYVIPYIAFGPMLALVVGQIGGALGGTGMLISQRVRRQRFWDMMKEVQHARTKAQTFQFGLQQIFVITAWLCVTLGFCKVFGLLDHPGLVIAVGLWGAWQTVVYRLGTWCVATYYRRQTEPQQSPTNHSPAV